MDDRAKKEIEEKGYVNILKDFVNNKYTEYCYDWQGLDADIILPCIEQALSEIERLNNIINELENRDDVLEEFEDWLERQKTRNSEWDNFIMVDGRLGIPISYLLNKLQELKDSDK